VCGESGGILVVSDYGHHPAEIRATLVAAARASSGESSSCFNRTGTRALRDLFPEFLDAFDSADRLFLTEVYAAGEDPIEG